MGSAWACRRSSSRRRLVRSKFQPRLNAEIQGDEMILKHYFDIGIAVGAEEGLVVPVLRDADRMSFAEIEKAIKDYARQVNDNTLPWKPCAAAHLRSPTAASLARC